MQFFSFSSSSASRRTFLRHIKSSERMECRLRALSTSLRSWVSLSSISLLASSTDSSSMSVSSSFTSVSTILSCTKEVDSISRIRRMIFDSMNLWSHAYSISDDASKYACTHAHGRVRAYALAKFTRIFIVECQCRVVHATLPFPGEDGRRCSSVRRRACPRDPDTARAGWRSLAPCSTANRASLARSSTCCRPSRPGSSVPSWRPCPGDSCGDRSGRTADPRSPISCWTGTSRCDLLQVQSTIERV